MSQPVLRGLTGDKGVLLLRSSSSQPFGGGNRPKLLTFIKAGAVYVSREGDF